MTGISALIAMSAAFAMQNAPVEYAPEPIGVGTLCEASDMTGVWSSKLLAPPADADSPPTVLSTDFIRLRPDGAMAYFATARQPESYSEIVQGLDNVEQLPGQSFKAAIERPGVLIISRDGVPTEGFTCTVIRNTDDVKEVVWTQLQGLPPVFRHNMRLSR